MPCLRTTFVNGYNLSLAKFFSDKLPFLTIPWTLDFFYLDLSIVLKDSSGSLIAREFPIDYKIEEHKSLLFFQSQL